MDRLLLQQPAQPELLKDLNRALVLSVVRRQPVLSRALVARQSGLSKATASALVDEFVQAGLLRDVGMGQSNGGRPPHMLEYVPEARLAIGLEFAHEAVVGVVTDLNAAVLRAAARPCRATAAADVLATVADLAGDLLEGLPRERLLGLGFASPGLVDTANGMVVQAVDVGWRDVPAADLLTDRVRLTTTVVNRAKAAALAERWRGSQAGAEHLIYISLGSGIAAGLVYGDELYLGATSSAGEIGHVTVEPAGPVCDCGNRGCLHVYAGEEAIARRARELARARPDSPFAARIGGDVRSITASAVIDAALQADPLAIQVLEEAAAYIGIALANVVNLLNPDAIVIGGPTSRAGALLMEGIEHEVRRRALTPPSRHVVISLSNLGDLAGAMGSAVFVMRQASRLIFGDSTLPEAAA